MKESCCRAEFLISAPQGQQNLGSRTHLNKLINVLWITKKLQADEFDQDWSYTLQNRGPQRLLNHCCSVLLTVVTSQLRCINRWKLGPKWWWTRWLKWQKRTKFCFLILSIFALPIKIVPNKVKAGSSIMCTLPIHKYKHFSTHSNLD